MKKMRAYFCAILVIIALKFEALYLVVNNIVVENDD